MIYSQKSKFLEIFLISDFLCIKCKLLKFFDSYFNLIHDDQNLIVTS